VNQDRSRRASRRAVLLRPLVPAVGPPGLLGGDDPGGTTWAMAPMLTMGWIDVAAIERACSGD